MHDTAYDVVDYPSHAFADTHPWRLAAMGILRGMEPAPVGACRVLEVGCGDGTNLLAMAHAFPDSTFVGIDLAARPVARGQAAARELGLTNLELHVQDLSNADAALGSFDYIIAHGVYSWVPAPVRDSLLALCGRLLAPAGIAFVSYLALPGTRLREMFRERMLAAAAPDDPPALRILRARAVMQLFAAGPESVDPFRELGRALASEVAALDDGVIFHDWLAPDNAALRITDFIAHAAQHGLSYVGEAEYYVSRFEHDPHVAAAREELDRLDAEDPIACEQLLDDLRFRRFRQTLLCREGVSLRRPGPDTLSRLALASKLKPEGDLDVRDRSVGTFVSPLGLHIRVDHPLTKAALRILSEAFPAAVPFDVLVDRAREASGSDGAGNAEAMAQALLQCAGSSHVEIFSVAPALTPRAGERPSVSPVARWEAARGRTVTTLRHASLIVSDDIGRAFFDLLDGNRDRAALGRALEDRGLVTGDVNAQIETSLERLAAAGVLEA